ELVRLYCQNNIQITRCSATGADFTLASDTYINAIVYSGGILTTTRRLLRTRPWPRHFSQGVVMTRPSPRQRSHIVTLTNWPKMDCCTRRISPVPWQAEQRVVDVPGCAPLPRQLVQVSQRGSSISLWQPKTASSKVIVRS